VWEETGVPGENLRGRAGDDLTFPHKTPAVLRSVAGISVMQTVNTGINSLDGTSHLTFCVKN